MRGLINKMPSDIRTKKIEKNIILYDRFGKYVAYAKITVPELTQKAIDQLKKYYLSVPSKFDCSRAIPITPRQLEAMTRRKKCISRKNCKRGIVQRLKPLGHYEYPGKNEKRRIDL